MSTLAPDHDKGKKAKAHRIVRELDILIGLFEDDEVFDVHEYRETQTLIDALLRARASASNILIHMGDESTFRNQPYARMQVKYREET